MKKKSPFTIYADFESILGKKIMESKIHHSLIQTNIKQTLLTVTAINNCLQKISLVSYLRHP